MSSGKASDFKVFDENKKGGLMAKRPLDASFVTLSSSSIADDAGIGDVLGTLSITGATVGTPRWEIIGQANFAVNSATGVVTVAHALTAGADSFKVKVRGTTPGVNSPTFVIAVTASEGGDTPEWVPENAKIYIDLVNDRAWTEADGEVAIDTLLGADANTENAFGTSYYDANLLTVDGYASPDSVAFIDGALTAILAGATVRVTITEASSPTSLNMYVMSADGNKAVGYVASGGLTLSDYSGGQEISGDATYNTGAGAKNAVAFTTTSGRAEAALNGSDVLTLAVTSTNYPTSGESQIVAALCYSGVQSPIQSITIYDALPSTAGLSALSAIA